MRVYLILEVDSISLDTAQTEAVRAYAAQAFEAGVKVVKPANMQEEEWKEEDRARPSPYAPRWDEELQAWIDPFGNWLVNYG